jgi:cobalt-zinc-cadmium efflux system outer membrane protein
MDNVLLDGVNLTQKLVDTGEINKGQMLQARLQRKQNNLKIRNSERRLTSAGQALAVVLGIDFVDLDAVVGEMDAAIPDYDFEVKFQSIAQSHPIIETARAEMLRHQWSVQRERAEPTPNLQSQLGLQFNNATDNVVVNLQFGLELPIHNQNSGRIAAATADYIRTSHKVKRLELALRQRYVTAFRDYTIAQQTLSQLENELLPLSQESLQSTQTLYKAGVTSYVGLLQAQKAYVDILLSLNDAKQQAWQAVAFINSGLMNGGLSLQN